MSSQIKILKLVKISCACVCVCVCVCIPFACVCIFCINVLYCKAFRAFKDWSTLCVRFFFFLIYISITHISIVVVA